MSRNIKDTWEYLGKNDPYYAVITKDSYRAENFNRSAEQAFFETGEQHIRLIWSEIAEHFIPSFQPQRALDFGCGVGRLLVPLSARCGEVAGIDISTEMLVHAKRNCEERQIENAAFYQSDDLFSRDLGTFDLIHSVIVLQHIHPALGARIVGTLLEMLENGGIGALHFPYESTTNRFAFLRARVYRDLPIINRIRQLVRGGKHHPLIPMYLYDLNRIFGLLQKNECHKCIVRFSEHGLNGVLLLFQKKREIIY